MRKLVILALVLALHVVGCAGAGTDYAQHVWDYRDVFVYENPNLDPEDVEAEIFALGAVLDLTPDEIEADLADHDDPEADPLGAE